MKKKLMMVAVLFGALSLGACVDDNESQSVTDVRNAKAEALKAVAALNNAQAEGELIRANAYKAYQEAQAEFYKAQAAAQNALAAEREFELQQAKEQYALELERIKLQAQFDLQQLQDAMAQYERGKLEQISNDVSRLYWDYYYELDRLNQKKYDLIDKQAELAKLEAGVISGSAWNNYYTMQSQQNIAKYEAQLAVLTDEAYAGLDNAELRAQAEAKLKECQLAEVAFAKDPTCAALLATSDPVKKAIEELDAQNELLDAINYIQPVVRWDGWLYKDFSIYTAVAYNYNRSMWGSKSVRENVRINETQKLWADRDFADEVERCATELGADTDTKDKNTAYGRLAKANDDLKVANEALTTANAMPGTTDAEKAAKEAAVSAAKGKISNAEEAIASAKDDLANKKADYDEAVANQKEYNDALTAFDVAAYNKAAAAFVAAVEAQEDAEEAWNEAKSSINDLWNEYSALNYLANASATDLNKQIALLEANIAQEKTNIEEHKYSNDSERTLEKAKADIEQLKAEIEALTIVADALKVKVDALKVRLDAAMKEVAPAE